MKLIHNDRVYYIQLVEHIKLMLHGTRQCIRNKTFLFVKIESWNFQNLILLYFVKPHRFSSISLDKQKSFINKCFKNWTISVHLNCLFQGFQVLNLLFVTPSCESSHLDARNRPYNRWKEKWVQLIPQKILKNVNEIV